LRHNERRQFRKPVNASRKTQVSSDARDCMAYPRWSFQKLYSHYRRCRGKYFFASVAIADKTARIIFALLNSGKTYQPFTA